MPSPCPICDDSGLRLEERPDGSRVARECTCREERQRARLVAAAEIPLRFQHCSFDSYETALPGSHPSLGYALAICRNFVTGYPIETDGQGLLLVGPNGTGKTHLAVSLLRALIHERGVSGLFVTYGDLLKRVQNSYNDSVKQTELDILRPVLTAEVLVIDELGSSKPTEWVLDTVSHILNTRYNDRLTTIVTTNHANERQLLGEGPVDLTKDQRAAWLAMYKENLGDRIGERMRSRLQEMCVILEMVGGDRRQGFKRASFVHVDRLVSSQTVESAATKGSAPRTMSPVVEEEEIVGPRRMGRNAKLLDVSGKG